MARGSSSKRVFSAASSGDVGKKRRDRTQTKSKGATSGNSKPGARDLDDAYTFMPELPKRHRTSAAQLSLSREEADEGPRRPRDDDSGDEDMAERIRRVAMMIAGDEAGVVEDDDDDDLDSDEAWESEGSDEERWGDVFRDLKKGKGKKGKEVVRKPAKPLTVDLAETDEESDPEVERSPRTAFKSAFPDEEEDEDEEDGEEEEDEEEAEDEEEESSDEELHEDPELPSDLSDDDEGMDGLEDFIDSLAATDKKRKADDSAFATDAGKKRRVLPVMSAPGLSDGGDLALKSKSKIDLSSLIASAEGLDAKALLPSKSDKKSTSVLKGGVLSAPLPTVVQDRLDREAAYEKTKEEGAKWSGAMKRVKEAEHLSFPLQASERGGVKSAGEMVATFKAKNAHESAVEALLAQANLTDKGVAAAEDAALRGQDLTVEEIAARRAELRHQRELMFRAESRAKRVAKIKSKTFRKLARKRDARDAEKAGEISLEDLERLDPEAAAEERERLERDRARERATLRHGAKTGRWARDLDAMEADEDQRMAKLEMLERKERLTRKIQGAASGSESESESSDEDEDEEAIKARAYDQLAKLDGQAAPEATKGIAGMAFMKKAAEREMKKVREAEAALRSELAEESAGSEDEDAPQMLRVGEGRMVFTTPVAGATPAAPKAAAAAPAAPPSRSPSPEPVLFGAANPWLDESGGSGLSRKRNTVSTSAESKAVRSLKKAGKDRAAAADDEVVEISLNVAPKAAKKTEAKPLKSILKKPKQPEPAADAGSGSDSESDSELLPVSGVKAFSQRELVAEAFAGDNVVEDFAAEKARAVAADAPVVEDTTLVGWGNWGGKGVKKRKAPKGKDKNPRFLKTHKGVAAEDRKDAGRDNVIITEKRDRKATKHLPADLPYPYTSVAQYEASFANPVGGEWNSRTAYQRQTLPRVTKKPGAIIEPIRKLF